MSESHWSPTDHHQLDGACPSGETEPQGVAVALRTWSQTRDQSWMIPSLGGLCPPDISMGPGAGLEGLPHLSGGPVPQPEAGKGSVSFYHMWGTEEEGASTGSRALGSSHPPASPSHPHSFPSPPPTCKVETLAPWQVVMGSRRVHTWHTGSRL